MAPDEMIYAMMADSIAEEGALHLRHGDNAYEDYPSPALTLRMSRISNGHIYPQYPSFYGVIAAPFYLAMGVEGLTLMNSLAFVGLLVMVFLLTRRLFDDEIAGLYAAFTAAFGGFIWIYSQTIFVHLSSLLFMVTAAYFCVRAYQTHKGSDALLCGLIFSFGFGVRYDVFFAAAALFVPWILCKPIRWRAPILIALGMLPMLVFLTYTNIVKFAFPSPFTYGPVGDDAVFSLKYVMIGVVAALVAGVLFAYTRIAAEKRRTLVLGVIVVALAGYMASLLLLPELVGKALLGIWYMLFDVRTGYFGSLEVSRTVVRTDTGGAIYFGSFKKALLQSCPYLLPAFVACFVGLKGRGEKRYWLWWVSIIPIIYCLAFGILSWHGTFGYNMRYIMPALPFCAILLGVLLRDLQLRFGLKQLSINLMVLAALIGLGLFIHDAADDSAYRKEWMLNTLPLDLALITSALVLLLYLSRIHRYSPLPLYITSGLIVITASWGGVQSALMEYERHNYIRNLITSSSENVFSHTGDRVLFFGMEEQLAIPMIEGRDVRIAKLPYLESGEELIAMINHHVDKGYRVFFTMERSDIEKIEDDLNEGGYELVPLGNKRINYLTHHLGEVKRSK